MCNCENQRINIAIASFLAFQTLKMSFQGKNYQDKDQLAQNSDKISIE